MASNPPPPLALANILGPETAVTRRCDILNNDGSLFASSAAITDGSVSVDMSRDERRTMDLTLSNTDGKFDNYPGGFWYDKVVRLFRGVSYADTTESYYNAPGTSTGFAYSLDKTPFDVVGDIDVAIEVTPTSWTPASEQTLVGKWNTASQRSWMLTILATGAIQFYWSTAGTAALTATSTVSTGLPPNTRHWVRATLKVNNGASGRTVSFYQSVDGRAWVPLGTPVTTATVTSIFNSTANIEVGSNTAGTANFFNGRIHKVVLKNGISGPIIANPNFTNLKNATVSFTDDYLNSWLVSGTGSIMGGQPITTVWESQLGEFLIDTIETQNFPHTTHVTGRDYTKVLMENKFATAITFPANQTPETVIKTLAQNAGITRFNIQPTGYTLGKEFNFEAGSSRWDAIKDIAGAFNCEAFFDVFGFLVLRTYRDPVTSPESYTFNTGPFGVLASFKKSSNNSRIFNKVVVIGQASGQTPVYAQATNTEPTSPTSIANLRYTKTYVYKSTFITTVLQAQDVANSLIKIMALETFNLNFTSIVLSWLDVAEVIRFVDPDPNPGDPDRFLLHDFTIPLKLGAMTANANRVTVVK